MSDTSIQWTDKTWNPVRGCTRVSEGCTRCYAETFAARNLPEMRSPTTGKPFAVRTPAGPRWTGAVELIPSKLDQPLRWRKPQRIFVNSMSDLFHESLKDGEIATVFGVMEQTQRHTFQVLTKRPRRMLAFMKARQEAWRDTGWVPRRNVWLGISVEDQATANERIPLLLQTPAAVRFVSYEPALGPVDFFRLGRGRPGPNGVAGWSALHGSGDDVRGLYERGLDWLIVGGESGPGARPFDLAWARSAVAQCKAAGVPLFTKQVGARPEDRCRECYGSGESKAANTSGVCPECRGDGIVVLHLRDRKGGDMSEWPEDLRVREMPH